MKTSSILLTAFLLVAASHLDAQTTSTAAQKFEVAFVKRCADGQPPKEGAVSPNRLHLACITAVNLIRIAYLMLPTGEPNAPIPPNGFRMPITGGPSWLESDRYTIDATTAQPVNIERMKGPMMQALLEERFGLKLHKETKQIPAFELTVGPVKPKLSPAKQGACVVYDRNHPPADTPKGKPGPVICGQLRKSAGIGFDVPSVTMADLCRELSKHVDREIVDKTGILDTFDVHLDLQPADLGESVTPDPSAPFDHGDGVAISAALKKLGLKMSNTKQPADFLVIDQVQRPSEN